MCTRRESERRAATFELVIHQMIEADLVNAAAKLWLLDLSYAGRIADGHIGEAALPIAGREHDQ
jgi:hypothetical protein